MVRAQKWIEIRISRIPIEWLFVLSVCFVMCYLDCAGVTTFKWPPNLKDIISRVGGHLVRLRSVIWSRYLLPNMRYVVLLLELTTIRLGKWNKSQ